MIWHLNNTTIRNPGRYLEALRAYEEHGFIEGLFTKGGIEAQKTFYNLILDAGLIDSEKRNVDWNGRKWRLGFRELGLIVYKSYSNKVPGSISKTGKALLNASNDAELQDIYFRIIYNLETRKKNNDELCFRPVPLILNVMRLLEASGEDSSINQVEFAVTLQDFREGNTPQDFCNEIIEFRRNKEAHKGKISEFYDDAFKLVWNRNKRKPNLKTISNDYPDVTFRLLKLSGLFRKEGKKLTLNSQYSNLLDSLCSDTEVSKSENNYYEKISNLPDVPIDKDRVILESIIKENSHKLNEPNVQLDAFNLEQLRIRRINQEDIIRKKIEEGFAHDQRHKVEVISKWFDCLIENKNIEEKFNGEYISFRSDERPQYLEWIVWRAFLAINNLSNKPYESRKFPLDNELKPTSHAPSKSPDLYMEFDRFNLVVEVTWTTSSRQVAAEGEPVIRHVAYATKDSTKPTYCLFIAPEININTLESYRNSDKYYFDDNSSILVNIVPISLGEFIDFFKNLPKAKKKSIEKILAILEVSTKVKKELSPSEWRDFISNEFKNSY